ncbi:VOC family protein [Mycobacterium intracellulare]|uniref:VOC family protein n=1 Tax=Mycobacterium intracellulare TaxID=1767 RepID=UPI00044F6F8E|nr:VOC family protein [Mycobacterium intracellulare]AOS93730.1 glyoxalase/bleomycin resistance/dioxygenase family protein [Mycobacterium intracellulare subsp. chimaera]ARV84196.1 glyoxalase/bleomycin resistance/dioxygenase family protein [Mycobacterium intracellulare subsp. chimaera]ASL11509.1 glyoxalase [Mycobacterium intracellulare subsp. chimaera]ASL23459.1 glyoxalase [Mycobacterium intracellulare subsp. chimaera]ETZ27152.1 glyoxalase/Bleomycin resistance /Dioxygenase superfamily protein [M
MSRQKTVFNHVGLCVSDCERSRRFYEELLGFQFWWAIDPPEEATATLLQLDTPIGLHAAYLIRDGLVLELLAYSKREPQPSRREMDHIGLTHLSFSVSDLAEVLERVEELGGSVVQETASARSTMIRDPDGQLLELLSDGWLSILPPRP